MYVYTLSKQFPTSEIKCYSQCWSTRTRTRTRVQLEYMQVLGPYSTISTRNLFGLGPYSIVCTRILHVLEGEVLGTVIQLQDFSLVSVLTPNMVKALVSVLVIWVLTAG